MCITHFIACNAATSILPNQRLARESVVNFSNPFEVGSGQGVSRSHRVPRYRPAGGWCDGSCHESSSPHALMAPASDLRHTKLTLVSGHCTLSIYHFDSSIRYITNAMNLLDLSLLGLLADQPLHGYELSKRLSEPGRASVSYGALYPALGRLDRRGFISSAAASAATPAPMTGSLGAEVARMRTGSISANPLSKRKRKVYTITDAGTRELHRLLIEPSDDDRVFAAQFACASRLGDAERLTLLHRRRHLVSTRLHGADAHRLDRYRRALIERDRLSDEAELAWLDALIAAESEPSTHLDHPKEQPIPPDNDSVARSSQPESVGGSIP